MLTQILEKCPNLDCEHLFDSPRKAILAEAENLATEVETDAKNDAAVIPITQDSLSSTVGYENDTTDDLWMLVVYGDKKAEKDKGIAQTFFQKIEIIEF